ncbi:hypothetical protein ACVK00_000104 [Burkholderia sp. PvR073]|uniref:hypothetical protein n=1 Tax=Burkholderia ambifaria TaxID=152480 RepID=UPI00339B4744
MLLADDSIFFYSVFPNSLDSHLQICKRHSRPLAGNPFAPADLTGKIFRIPIGLPDAAYKSLSTTTHIDRHDAR